MVGGGGFWVFFSVLSVFGGFFAGGYQVLWWSIWFRGFLGLFLGVFWGFPNVMRAAMFVF